MALYRVVLLGDGGVGKSCITVQFTQNYFVKDYDPTIENSYRKQVSIDNEACIIDVLDTAGQEEYAVMRDQYINSGQGFLIVYSVVNRSSFNSLVPLIEQIHNVKEEEHFPMVLVGNKCDLPNREVSLEEGKAAADKYQIPLFESSAKNRLNIEESFYTLVREIRKYEQPQGKESPSTGSRDTKRRSQASGSGGPKKPCILL